MAAGKYNFTIEQGTTVRIELAYKNTSGSAIDLTGYSGRMQIRPDFADNTTTSYIYLSSSLNADGTGLNFSGSNGVNPPTSGTIGVFISAESSSAFNFETAYYDIELQSGSIVTRLLQGKVKLSREVTRP
ncbi:hypothetical protein UFOVP449_114 [uncultured Caudovirales phage]|uniref:Uncharacterized protein n=1 Tax=uncultured Caudovirales phage TaxID=2100421 RepID=A0A6J5MHA5_9CAUD|nr:hypothetical protein UFOVP449_114 [uncultured Caudovirales phage]